MNVFQEKAALQVVNAMFTQNKGVTQMLSVIQNQIGTNTEKFLDVKTALNCDLHIYIFAKGQFFAHNLEIFTAELIWDVDLTGIIKPC